MSAEIRVPKDRTCLECGRREAWDESKQNWVVAGDDVGDVDCIHAWDITGEFTPVRT